MGSDPDFSHGLDALEKNITVFNLFRLAPLSFLVSVVKGAEPITTRSVCMGSDPDLTIINNNTKSRVFSAFYIQINI
jgi:hypothetical protein